MKIAALLLALSLASTAHAQSKLIRFDELPAQPIDGLTLQGVRFSFTEGGTASADARFNANGPGTTTYISDPSLEGTTAGTLTLDFAGPVSNLSFGVALSSFNTVANGVRVDLRGPDQVSLAPVFVTLTPQGSFAEALFNFAASPVVQAKLTFDPSATRFVMDNLSFEQVPEPAAGLTLLAGAALLGTRYFVRRRVCQK